MSTDYPAIIVHRGRLLYWLSGGAAHPKLFSKKSNGASRWTTKLNLKSKLRLLFSVCGEAGTHGITQVPPNCSHACGLLWQRFLSQMHIIWLTEDHKTECIFCNTSVIIYIIAFIAIMALLYIGIFQICNREKPNVRKLFYNNHWLWAPQTTLSHSY